MKRDNTDRIPRVLVIATSRKTRGGITAVIKAYEESSVWKKFHCHWVQTHRDGSICRKLFYFATAWIDFLMRIPFYRIVHIHFSLPMSAKRKTPFVKVAKALGKKIIVHLHCGSQIHDIWNADYDYLLESADVCVLLSESLLQSVEDHMRKNRNLCVVYNPCPIVSMNPVLPKTKSILFSGTLYDSKGYRDLIRAFGMIASKFPEWKLIIAGNGEIEKGKKLTEELGIGDAVQFPGWLRDKEKDEVFRKASVFCLPSHAEGFPMAILDAWAYGIPVVTTPVGGIPDIAVDEENMLLFNPGNVDKLAEQLERIIASYEGDGLLYNRIRTASLDFAENKFNADTISRQLGELYGGLV